MASHIMRNLLITISLLFIQLLEAQVVTSSFTDPCTGEIKTATAQVQGSGTLVTIYNQSRMFTAQEIIAGVFVSWATSAYQAYQALSPCSQGEAQTQATTQAVQQTAQEAAKAAAQAVTSQPVQTTTPVPTTTTAAPVQTTTTNPTTTEQTQTTQTGTTNTNSNETANQNTTQSTSSGSNDTSTADTTSTSGSGTDATDSTSGETTSTESTQQEETTSTTDQGSENTSSETQETSSEDSGSSSEGAEDNTSGDSDNSTSEDSSGTESEESTDSSSEATEESSSEEESGGEGNEENTEGEEGDGGESSDDEQEAEEVTEEESTEEESTEEESTEEENSEEESTEEEKEEDKKEEKKKKKKKKKNTTPPIIVANISTMEGLDRTFSTAMTLGYSKSSLRGDKTYGVTSMIWSNFKQYMVMGNFSKVFMKEGKPKFVYSAALMGSRMFTTLTGGINNSFVYLGNKGMVVGASLGITSIQLNYEIRDGGILVDQSLLSGAFTTFFTKPYNFDRYSISPMVAVSAPFVTHDLYQNITTYNTDLTVITGASANYMITRTFAFNLGVNVIHNTNKDIRSLFSFTIGSRFSF